MWDQVSDPVGPSEARLDFCLRSVESNPLSSFARPGRVRDPAPHNSCRSDSRSKSRNQEKSAANCDQIFRQGNHPVRQPRGLYQACARLISRKRPHHSARSAEYRADGERVTGRGTERRSRKRAQYDTPEQRPRRSPVRNEGQLVGNQFSQRQRGKTVRGRVDSINTRREPSKLIQPRWAAQQTSAGPVIERRPVTNPIPKARR